MGCPIPVPAPVLVSPRGEETECLNEHEFWSLKHARDVLERIRSEYNTEHLHGSLGFMTPEEYAAALSMGA